MLAANRLSQVTHIILRFQRNNAHLTLPFSSSTETFPNRAVCALCRNKIDVAATCLWNYKQKRGDKMEMFVNMVGTVRLKTAITLCTSS
jgi:hypothetical protein